MTTKIQQPTYDYMILALTKLRDARAETHGWAGSSAYTLGTLEAILQDVLDDDQGREVTRRLLRALETILNSKQEQPTHY